MLQMTAGILQKNTWYGTRKTVWIVGSPRIVHLALARFLFSEPTALRGAPTRNPSRIGAPKLADESAAWRSAGFQRGAATAVSSGIQHVDAQVSGFH